MLRHMDELKSKLSKLGYQHKSLSVVNFALEQMNRRMGTSQQISPPELMSTRSDFDESLVITTATALENLSSIIISHRKNVKIQLV